MTKYEAMYIIERILIDRKILPGEMEDVMRVLEHCKNLLHSTRYYKEVATLYPVELEERRKSIQEEPEDILKRYIWEEMFEVMDDLLNYDWVQAEDGSIRGSIHMVWVKEE